MFHLLKYRGNALRKMMPYAKGTKRFFLTNLFLSVVLITADFIVPLCYKEFIEETIIRGRIETFLPIAVSYVVLHLLVVGTQYWKNYNNNRIRNRVTFRVKHMMWRNLFRKEFSEYEHQSIGDVKMNLEDDVAALANFSGYYTIDYLIHLVTLLACTAILFTMEWRLALFSIVCIPLTVGIDMILSKREMELNGEQRENNQRMNTWLYSSLQGWKEIKALHLENRQRLVFTQYMKKYALYYAKWINYWTMRALILPKLRNEFFMRFGLYFLGGLLVMKGKMTIGALLVFATYFEMLMNSVMQVSTIDADLQGKRVYVDRLFSVLEQEFPKESGVAPERIESIRLRGIRYGYPGKEEVLRDVNLSIRSGERVAIVGKSGCGKTTLLKIMVGMLHADAGTVEYSGIDSNTVRLSTVHKRIGFIMQSSPLYHMSIRDNLLLGNREATEEELKEACEKACILEFIQSLPEGFDTIIGEGGSKLSGGQKQRIILARTFLRDVDVLLFDEATSALDQYSEKIINDAIANVGKDKIVIIVAHRESSIQLCNRVIRLDEGTA